MNNYGYDVIIVWLAVHGGSFHKVLHLHDMMRRVGLRSKVILNCDPPLGLQVGLDIDQARIRQLAEVDVHVLTSEEIMRMVGSTAARLFLFDAHENDMVGELVSLVRRRHAAKTGQLTTLLDDFCYWDTDYVFLQHPITLWFILERRHREDAGRLVSAKKIFFAGNILYEPVCNTWTSDICRRDQFYSKYGFDDSLPLCLWLPDRVVDFDRTYGKVIETVRSVPMNLAVKLHPWEYKNLRHGFDPRYGVGVTSADRWGISAIEERDSTWALKFCNVAIVASSAVGIEMPWWRKPLIYIGPSSWRTEVVRACSLRLDDADGLSSILKNNYPFTFSAEDYDQARNFIFPNSSLDSFQLHLKYILEVLDTPFQQPSIGKARHIMKLYRDVVPESWRESSILRLKSWMLVQFPQVRNSVIWKRTRWIYRLYRRVFSGRNGHARGRI